MALNGENSKAKQLPQTPQWVVTAGRSFVSEMPESGLKIRNSETGITYHIEAQSNGGILVTKSSDSGLGEGVIVHPKYSNQIEVL